MRIAVCLGPTIHGNPRIRFVFWGCSGKKYEKRAPTLPDPRKEVPLAHGYVETAYVDSWCRRRRSR